MNVKNKDNGEIHYFSHIYTYIYIYIYIYIYMNISQKTMASYICCEFPPNHLFHLLDVLLTVYWRSQARVVVLLTQFLRSPDALSCASQSRIRSMRMAPSFASSSMERFSLKLRRGRLMLRVTVESKSHFGMIEKR